MKIECNIDDFDGNNLYFWYSHRRYYVSVKDIVEVNGISTKLNSVFWFFSNIKLPWLGEISIKCKESLKNDC